MSKAAESSTLTWVVEMASIGRQFMDIMEDYMARQDEDIFDVAVEIDDLYKDLSNLYFNNAQ
jgi:hypothetical protein|tara:strand:- start:606 stop:791 length:186 start_codon:yes stop_codon:yes gene_type:complete